MTKTNKTTHKEVREKEINDYKSKYGKVLLCKTFTTTQKVKFSNIIITQLATINGKYRYMVTAEGDIT